MDVEGEVARHYTQSELTSTVLAALRTAGRDTEALATDDLAGVDEFHTGWRPLTLALARQLAPTPGTRILDVGAGIGGPARHFAEAYGCDVTGIDLTPAFVELATELTERTGLADRVRFVTGSALAMPFPDGAFDLATMFHVGMNIADKPALFAEIARVLRPGGRFVVYDLMRVGGAALPWPMPWADDAPTSFVETPARYRELLEDAGFGIEAERDWTDLVLEEAARMRGRLAAQGIPVVGLHLLMGPDGMDRLRRVGDCVRDRVLAPLQMTAALPA
jgi:ubiquinone/menaquinone biosynthesis C-methylase UbiE